MFWYSEIKLQYIWCKFVFVKFCDGKCLKTNIKPFWNFEIPLATMYVISYFLLFWSIANYFWDNLKFWRFFHTGVPKLPVMPLSLYIFFILITHSQREAYMVLVRNGGGSGGSGSGGSGSGGSGRQLSQNPQAISKFCM